MIACLIWRIENSNNEMRTSIDTTTTEKYSFYATVRHSTLTQSLIACSSIYCYVSAISITWR
jgi:hypothetical protein